MEALNVLPPSIEPHASGHIMEQIEFVQKILDAGICLYQPRLCVF